MISSDTDLYLYVFLHNGGDHTVDKAFFSQFFLLGKNSSDQVLFWGFIGLSESMARVQDMQEHHVFMSLQVWHMARHGAHFATFKWLVTGVVHELVINPKYLCGHLSKSPCLIICTFPETNSSHLKLDGWKLEYCTTFLLGPGLFSWAMLVLGFV